MCRPGRGRKAESPAEVATPVRRQPPRRCTPPAGPAPSTCWDGRIAVSPRGEVYPCIFSRGAKVGSVADTPLPQVLARRPLAGLWALTTDDVPECRDCDRKGVCFDCRALPLTALGDVTAKNPRCDYVPPARRPRRPRPEAARVRPGLLGRDLAGERLLVDAATARLHRLDAGAAAILDALVAGASEAALAAGLTRRFGLAPDEAASEVATVADGLWDAGLLVDPAGRDVTGDRVLAGVAPPPVPDALGLAAGAADPAAGRAVADTPAAEVPRRALLGLLGRTVALAADAAAWAELEALLAPLAADPGATPEATISVVSRRSAPHLRALHHVLVDGRQVRAVRTPGALRSAVEEVLCTLAAEGQGDLRLHAAVLVGPAGAVLIPGASGAGKSLLALAGVAAGLGYGTDEAARIPLVGEVVVDALPKPVTVKAAGRPWVPPALTARWIPPDVADPDDYAWVPLVGSAPAPVVAVVLPIAPAPPRASPPARPATPPRPSSPGSSTSAGRGSPRASRRCAAWSRARPASASTPGTSRPPGRASPSASAKAPPGAPAPELRRASALVGVPGRAGPVEGLLHAPRRDPAQEVLGGAGLVVGPRAPAPAEGLLADHRAGGLVVDVEVPGGKPEALLGVVDGRPVPGEDGAGEPVLGGGVADPEHLLVAIVGEDVEREHRPEDLLGHQGPVGSSHRTTVGWTNQPFFESASPPARILFPAPVRACSR